jgi:hypothetical protein
MSPQEFTDWLAYVGYTKKHDYWRQKDKYYPTIICHSDKAEITGLGFEFFIPYSDIVLQENGTVTFPCGLLY